jgi:NAD+ kinase
MRKQLVIDDRRNVALVYRPETAQALSLAKALTRWLKDRDYHVYTAPEQKALAGTKALQRRSELSRMSLLVVLGGDGTYLRATRLLEGKSIPILGVNLGSLGFLTPFRADELFTAVEHTLENKMEIRPRAMIQYQLLRKRKIKQEGLALNDVVIERGSLSQLINIAIRCDKKLVSEVKADGIIVASPTGSTAYNLAAGGPILHNEVKAFVVTSIAPHSLTTRPFIFPDESKLSFKFAGRTHDKNDSAHLVIDGIKVAKLNNDDEIIVKKSEMSHWMVRDANQNGFAILREKLKFGDR